MTSGQFHRVSISQIWLDREKRQRKTLTDIPGLAQSIATLGLINPIVIKRDFELVAGERRLAAHKHLGLIDIQCQYVDEIDPLYLHQLELEENIKRVQLDWRDECLAVEEYDRLRRAQDPGWNQDKTGEALGITQANVSDRIRVAEAIKAGDKQIIEAPKYSVAKGIVERKAARAADGAIAAIRKTFGGSNGENKTPVEKTTILNTSFVEWAESYDGPRFNFIHCDFPYGIGADGFNQGGAAAHGGYEDSAETYWNLCRSLARNLNRIATDSAHIMFWFSMEYYHETLQFFADETDFKINKFPLIWTKSDNSGILPDATRGPRRIYETAFFGSRGDRPIVRACSNSHAAPSVRGRHMSEKNEAMLRYFFGMFVDENTAILDPTCGSGSALRAADSMGAAYVQGLELNPEFATLAEAEFRKARALRKAAS